MKLFDKLSISRSLKKLIWSLENFTRNAHSKTAEKLDMKIGQWNFCLWLIELLEDDFSERNVHSVHCHFRWHADWFVKFHGYLDEYSLDLCQVKKVGIFIELEILWNFHIVSKWTYHLNIVKTRHTILPWYTQRLSAWVKAISHSVISLPWKFEFNTYQNFREK